jgi:hypothetical protein
VKNIFVIGLDAFNQEELQSIREAQSCRFIGLLGYDEIVLAKSGTIEFEFLRSKAEKILTAFPGSIDGIAAFWDFPSSAMAGVLRNSRGLPGPSNEAIARCEHKYWSRLEQREVVPDLIPGFCAVDPFADDPLDYVDINYPFWIKPVKAHSSRLGFKIHSPDELRAHIPEIRDKIAYFGRPFGEFLDHVGVPEAVRPITGYWCIAEEIISAGQQCTLEGYVYEGEVVVYGIVDSIRGGKHRSCLMRYQYPSSFPARIQKRMIEATASVMTQFGYDCAPFNIEFFWDRRTDRIRLLEVNARISKSHCPLFRMVDGASHQEVMVDLALGERPRFPNRKGPFPIAGKFMRRVFEDGVVSGMPTANEIAKVQKIYPEARFRLLSEVGDRLKYSHHCDSYSYELADIFLGGRNQADLLGKYQDILNRVTFTVDPACQDAA